MKITVMSFNLRYDKPDPGVRQWKKRVGAIASVIQHYKPDIIGTQEGKLNQLEDLQALLPEYGIIGGDRTGTGQGEHCAIFYNPQFLKLQQTKDFFLSDTPEIPGSITWGTRLPRMATWANFELGNSGLSLTILNTHLDHESPKARELGAALITQYLAAFDPKSHLLLMGDFNANPSSPSRQIFLSPLTNGKQLQDALAVLPLEQQKTFHDFTGEARDAIDTIYFDPDLQLEQVKIDNQQWEGVWPSDHFPVIVKLTIVSSFE
ncbi:endonuclease/exonuclease/phosphatase family protein [Cronbergia sp. UHCC 0137]|uniref:endonuclease/exonuclease/phosphatase family protein n=1 Tax=Cronbergia sp. UHCC 0137 TaxID=3110239 RepID=UPI002B1F2BCF|nr:endonuclease/exonuclease/phosphatase family protein [Cronbergia sp. UHCC 0137]MEA5617272.1 endonuclease/exonuclease/phosphatase family protein [Cronbergia sp. UHCC 0137]